MLVSSLIALTLLAASPVSEKSKLLIQDCVLGEHYQFDKAECAFDIHNTGAKPVKVISAKAVSPSDKVSPNSVVIGPGATTRLVLDVDFQDYLGQASRFITLETDEAFPKRTLVAQGFVLSDFDDGSPRVDFGVVDFSAPSEMKLVAMSSLATDLSLERIIEAPSWIHAEIDRNGKDVRLTIEPGAPWGLVEGKVKIAARAPHQKEVWITVTADVHGDIVPSSNPMNVGLMRVGENNEFVVQIRDRQKRDFRIGAIKSEELKVRLSTEKCAAAEHGCWQVRVKLLANQPTGVFNGKLLVELPDSNKVLPIVFGGMLAAKDIEVKDYSELVKEFGGKKSNSGSISQEPKSPLDLGKVLKSNVAQAEVPTPVGEGPLLKWTVENEQQIYGYSIYRADNESGAFMRVNPTIIRKASLGNGWTYKWRDTSATKGNTYWYKIGVTHLSGRQSQLSGVQKAIAH